MKNIFIFLLTILCISSADSIHPYPVGNPSLSEEPIVILDRHIVEINENHIEISYPMALGIENKDRVNEIIRNYIYEMVERDRAGIYEMYGLLLILDYKIEFLNDKFISIKYEGSFGAIGNAGRGYIRLIYTLNIDMQEGKIINKEDIIKNEKEIFELLMQDRFEIIGGTVDMPPFSSTQAIRKNEGMKASNLDYYINEGKFIIVQGAYSAHAKCSIDLDEVKEYLDEDIVEKICGTQKEEQG